MLHNMLRAAAGNRGSFALSFDGVNDYVITSSAPDIFGTQPVTIEAWVYINTFPTSDYYYAPVTIVDGSAGASVFDKDIRIQPDGSVDFHVYDGAGRTASSTFRISSGTWYHVAGVFDGTNIFVYIDAVQEGSSSASGTFNHSSPKVQFAYDGNATSERFDGMISDARIWNTARTQTQIQNNKDIRLAGSEIGLIAYYRLDDGSGTTATDSAGAYDGSLVNGPTWTEISQFPPS